MPQTKMVTYNDFTKGEWGELGEFRAPIGSFTGNNVILYTNGMLGPRAGLRENTYSGTPPQGDCHGIWLIGQIGRPLMISVGDKLYSSTDDNDFLGTVTLEHTLASEPNEPLVVTWYDPNGNVFLSNIGDRCHVIDMTADTINDLPVRNGGADNAGTETLFLCKDRLYAAGDANAVGGNGGQYVYVSAAADFTNFSGGETFQVGYFNSIRGMAESQNSLMFSCLEATNNLGSGVGWYSLVGATPQGALHRVNTQAAGEGQWEIVNAESGNIYFWTGWTAADQDNPYLVQTNGAKFDDQSYKHLRLGGTDRFGYYNAPDQTLIYVTDENDAMMRVNGAWTKHSFSVDVSGPVCPTERGDSFLLPHSAPGVDLKVYQLLTRPDQPQSSVSGISNPGDASTLPVDAYFALPAFQSDTKEMRVRRVIVDFKKWDCSLFFGVNAFTVNVKTYGQYNLPSGTTDGSVTTSFTWTEDESLSATDGTLDRFVARLGNQGKAAAFQISITGMAGVAIESITVEYDEESMEGRTL